VRAGFTLQDVQWTAPTEGVPGRMLLIFSITIFYPFSIPLRTPYGGANKSLGDRLFILPGLLIEELFDEIERIGGIDTIIKTGGHSDSVAPGGNANEYLRTAIFFPEGRPA
jgi:hypothetical protein